MLLPSLFATGRSSQVLFSALNQTIGTSTEMPDFSEDVVSKLADDAIHRGEAARGSLLFKSMACVTCHRVAGSGGEVGPDLTSIGTTLSTERIIEELLWPNRQIKEGYQVLQVVTDDGKIVQGYERRTKEGHESGDLMLKELTTGDLIRIEKQRIEEKLVSGSPMPTGLTSVLSRPQLLDLVRYLSELGRID